MALFRRTAARAPISEFWQWWSAEGRAEAEASIAAGEYGTLPDRLTRMTAAIHPGLSWHFSTGDMAKHALTVTAGGIADTRPAAERWLRAAPAADATWEFRSSQRADPDATSAQLQLGDTEVDVAATVFTLTPQHSWIDVGVFNPAFPHLSDGARGQATFLMLDWILGEDAVTRWLGAIDPLYYPPADQRSIAELQAAIAEREAKRDPDLWSIMTAELSDGSALVGSLRTGLHWLDMPTLDLHHEITTRLTSDDLGPLQNEEEPLEDLLGDRGVFRGTMTGAGRRVVHFYTDGEDQNATDAIRAWAKQTRRKIVSKPDPGWKALRAYGI